MQKDKKAKQDHDESIGTQDPIIWKGKKGIVSQKLSNDSWLITLDENKDKQDEVNPTRVNPNELTLDKPIAEQPTEITPIQNEPITTLSKQPKYRHEMRSKIIFWIIFCGIFVLILYTCSRCDLPSNTKPEPAKTDAQRIEDKNISRRILRGDYDDVFGLLAIKYGIGIDTVDYISTEYLRIYSPSEYYLITQDDPKRDSTVFENIFKPKQSVSTTINYLGEKYQIENQKIASILFDFRLFIKNNK